MTLGTENQFRTETEEGRYAEAYLLLGKSREDLDILAERMAGIWLQVENPSESPDFFLLHPELLGVPGLRVSHITLREDDGPCLETAIKNKPAHLLGRRAVILAHADTMSRDAQGALLKTLEEPPDGTLLFLTATGLSSILPAIRSRCRLVRVPPRGEEELARRSAAAGVAPKEWAILKSACGGGEAAIALSVEARNLLLQAHPEFHAWLAGGPHSLAWESFFTGGERKEMRARLEILLAGAFSWAVALYPASSSPEAFTLDQVLECLMKAQADLAGNLSPEVVLDDLLGEMNRTISATS